MARIAVAVVMLTAVMAGCGARAQPRSSSAPSWHLLDGQYELAAANVPFAARDRTFASPPARTVATLPRPGTVIWVMVYPGADPYLPQRRLPLRLDDARPS